MVTIDITGDKKFREYLRGVLKGITLEIPKLTQKEAMRNAVFARSIAPRDTGALIQAIKGEKGRARRSSRIVSRTPNNKNGRNIPYHFYMNRGTRGNYHGKDQYYMRTTWEKIREEFPEKVKRQMSKIIRG